MCLAYPARVAALVDADTVEATFGGRRVLVVVLTLDAGPPVRVGDWLLVQSGLAVSRLSAPEAQQRQLELDALIGGHDDA